MNSLPTRRDNAAEPVLVGEGGVPYRRSVHADPFEAWIDMMEAVEALCPHWPERHRMTEGVFRL